MNSLSSLMLAVLLAAAPALADKPEQALSLVQSTAAEMQTVLRANQVALRQNPNQLYDLISEIVLPHFDFPTIARWILGRHWSEATPEQRQRFTEEFRTLLVRTYGNALLEYAEENLTYAPLQAEEDAERVTVRSQLQPASGPAIPINYNLHRRNEVWQIYDVNVDGVSLVANYRSSIGSQIGREGLEAVIDQLSERNRRGS